MGFEQRQLQAPFTRIRAMAMLIPMQMSLGKARSAASTWLHPTYCPARRLALASKTDSGWHHRDRKGHARQLTGDDKIVTVNYVW